jgi:GNAT superfamily N-acetyltransferase
MVKEDKAMTTRQTEIETLPFPGAPDIPGLCLRRFRGEVDYEVLTSIVQQSLDADGIDFLYTVDDARRFYEHPHNFDPYEDTMYVQVGSETVGYFDVTWRRESQGNRIYRHGAYLLPAWRRKGIGTAMLRWMEERLKQIASGHPEDGARLFRTWADSTDDGKLALLKSHGYVPVRYFFEMVRNMEKPLPTIAIPPGLELRPASPEHYRPVWKALEEAFKDHWGHSPHVEADYLKWIKDRRFQPDLWTIVWDGDQVAGTVLNYIDEEENEVRDRKRGYTEDICVRRPWRRRGLARAMLVKSIQRLKDLGMTEAALGVDTDNPSGALRLYKSVGFEPVRKSMVLEKPL